LWQSQQLKEKSRAILNECCLSWKLLVFQAQSEVQTDYTVPVAVEVGKEEACRFGLYLYPRQVKGAILHARTHTHTKVKNIKFQLRLTAYIQ
jgi:hypothetical protein